MKPPSSLAPATPQGGRSGRITVPADRDLPVSASGAPAAGRPLTDRQNRIRGGKPGSWPEAAARPPKAPPPRKARVASECERLEQLPNIGPSIAGDLRSLGIEHPQQLEGRDPHALYLALCEKTGRRQDPCVLDTFMAATAFMGGAEARPWWDYTADRKARYGVS
jgi:Pathogenicity locus